MHYYSFKFRLGLPINFHEFIPGAKAAILRFLEAVVNKDLEFLEDSGTVHPCMSSLVKMMLQHYESHGVKFVFNESDFQKEATERIIQDAFKGQEEYKELRMHYIVKTEGEGIYKTSGRFQVISLSVDRADVRFQPLSAQAEFTPVSLSFDINPMYDNPYHDEVEDGYEYHSLIQEAKKRKKKSLDAEDKSSLPGYVHVIVSASVWEAFDMVGEKIVSEFPNKTSHITSYRFVLEGNLKDGEDLDWRIVSVLEPATSNARERCLVPIFWQISKEGGEDDSDSD
jgi:hypothetical protein